MKYLIFFAISMVVLSACSGTMNGVIRGDGTKIDIAFEEGMNASTLSSNIDGELFTGKAVLADQSSFTGTSFDSDFDSTTIFGSTTTGRAAATLLGTRGSTLTCRLQYASPDGLIGLGGVGVCKHSDGRTIDVVW